MLRLNNVCIIIYTHYCTDLMLNSINHTQSTVQTHNTKMDIKKLARKRENTDTSKLVLVLIFYILIFMN